MLAPLLGLPKQSEILIIIFLGICFLSLDFSLFEIESNLKQVWKLELNKAKHLETILKYIITAVVLARTFTLHAFVAFYIVMLWPAIFEEKPNLILPWLFLGVIRCLILNCITLVIGTFICHKEKGLSPICSEYIIAQIIEHGPSVYAWFSVLSFYRDLAAVHDSEHSSEESLLSADDQLIENQDVEENENSLDKSKSYSLSDLNLDYMHSSRFRRLSSDMPIDVLLKELKHLVSKTRIVTDSSKSFNSLQEDNKTDYIEVFETLSKKDLSIIEKTMKILDVSEQDVIKAKQDKFKLIKILKEVNVQDVQEIDEKSFAKITSPSFYIRKGTIRKGIKTHIPKSLSFHEETNKRDSCMCYLRRKLQKDQSNQSLVETEIANINFDESDKDCTKTNGGEGSFVKPEIRSCEGRSKLKNCEAKCKKFDEDFAINFIKNDIPQNLNRSRVVAGASLGLNTTNFIRKLNLKNDTRNNFGCQVSFLKHSFLVASKSDLGKNLAFLQKFKLFEGI